MTFYKNKVNIDMFKRRNEIKVKLIAIYFIIIGVFQSLLDKVNVSSQDNLQYINENIF